MTPPFSRLARDGKLPAMETVIPPDIYHWDALPPERRRHNRVQGEGLMANVNGKLVDVLDISFGGVRLAHGFSWEKPHISFQIIRRTNRTLHLNESLRVGGRIVEVTDTSVRIQFDRVMYALVKLIVHTKSKALGVTPHLVK